MKLSDFSFELPEALIAKHPAKERTASRLLCLNASSGAVAHHKFVDIVDMLNPGDLLIFNNTRVIPARLFGQKETGGKIEMLIERVLEDQTVLAHIKSSKSPKQGSRLTFEGNIQAVVLDRKDNLFHVTFEAVDNLFDLLEMHGHMPLPPYIDRPDEDEDKERYQTVYNEKPGAVAAPTAGLHFDEDMLTRLQAKGINMGFVTLHVGAGTFQPVRVDNIEDHIMHSEFAEVPSSVVDKVLRAKLDKKRVIAVGTTSVRSLEAAAQVTEDTIAPFMSDTSIFIYPGFEFKVVDAMITNFHLPESTLMMLISAFSDKNKILNAYQQAIEYKYRFFSYGDAMFIHNRKNK